MDEEALTWAADIANDMIAAEALFPPFNGWGGGTTRASGKWGGGGDSYQIRATSDALGIYMMFASEDIGWEKYPDRTTEQRLMRFRVSCWYHPTLTFVLGSGLGDDGRGPPCHKVPKLEHPALEPCGIPALQGLEQRAVTKKNAMYVCRARTFEDVWFHVTDGMRKNPPTRFHMVWMLRRS